MMFGGLASQSFAQSCEQLFPSGSQVPGGYGASWNVLTTTKELLLSGVCSGNNIEVTVGSNKTNQYVYNHGFYWNGSQWRQLNLSGSNPAVGSWLAREGKGSFPKGNQSPAIFVGYVCQYSDNKWKCGCADNACTTPRWQVQAVRESSYGGGTGNPTGDLLPPPPMDNPLVVENVCPEDSRWPSNSQMAGRDVKITLPKDRVCKKVGNLGGTKSQSAHDIWVSGGELDIYSSSPSNGAGLTLTYWDGTALFEGLYIDINNSCMDGIRTYFPRSGRVIIQNSYIAGMSYCTPGTHGDLFHAQGGDGGKNITELIVQNLRGDLINQGFFVPPRPDGHGVNRLVLDHVEMRLDSRFKFSQNKISTMVFADPTGGGGNNYPPNGQSYNEVYLNWWEPWYPGTENRTNIVLPAASSFDSKGCAVYSSDVKNKAKLDGAWCKGSPPGGTFVPLDKIGRNYDRSFFAK